MRTAVRICVNGSRGFEDREKIYEALDNLIPEETRESVVLITGGCRGPDTIAEEWAIDRGVEVEVVRAKWLIEGRAAGPKRNARMIKLSDRLISFWDGKSRGTKGTIELANIKKIPVTIVEV